MPTGTASRSIAPKAPAAWRAASSIDLQAQAADLAEREMRLRRESWEQQFRAMRSEIAERDRRILMLEQRVFDADTRAARGAEAEAQIEQQREEVVVLRRQLNDLAALALRLRAAEGEKLEAEQKLAITQKELAAVQGKERSKGSDRGKAHRADSVRSG